MHNQMNKKGIKYTNALTIRTKQISHLILIKIKKRNVKTNQIILIKQLI
jgi:hypothetical protein